MSTEALAAADAVAVLLAWERAHPTVLAEFGGATHVSGMNEAPYPHLQIAPSPGGSDRDLRWLTEQEVTLRTFGALDGTPGQSALWRLHKIAISAAAELPDATFSATDAVVSAVRSSSTPRIELQPLTQQPAWVSTLILSIRPPLQIP